MQELVVYVAKSKKVMYSITFVILPVTKTIFCTRGCFSASLGLKMNIDSLSWPYGHLRLSNLSFPALVTLENNHSYQKLFPTLGKWQMNEVKYYCITHNLWDKVKINEWFVCLLCWNPKTTWLFKVYIYISATVPLGTQGVFEAPLLVLISHILMSCFLLF